MSIYGFDPIEGEDALVLILGTLPGKDSIKAGEYYADPGNAFWYIMGKLFDANVHLRYEERVKALYHSRVAIWDVLKEAERSGSTDKKIVKGTEVANDFKPFLAAHSSLITIFFNGEPADKYFRKKVWRLLPANYRKVGLCRLPSTSSANTHATKEAKLEEWRAVQRVAMLAAEG